MAATSSGAGLSAPAAAPPATEAPSAEVAIRFRLSDLDFVLERTPSPYDNRVSPFLPPGQRLEQVPVVRIFGATDQGQRVCAQIHGAFSYLYVEYKGSLNPEILNSYIYKFGRSLNRAMDLTQKQGGGFAKRGVAPQFIAFILPCKAIPIYGFQVGYKTYLKIYITNPRHKRAVSELLRNGAVKETKFELFEDHIPFHLQFMLDANLYGSGWVEVSHQCRFRTPLPEEAPVSSMYYGPPTCTGPYGTRTYTSLTVPSKLVHSSSGPPKDTNCTLELDLPLSALLNRRKVFARDIHQDFVEYLRPETVEKDKLVKSLKELWVDEERRRNARGEEGPKDISDTAPRLHDTRDPKEPFWAVEEEMRRKIDGLAAKSLDDYRAKVGLQKDPMFGTYLDDLAKMSRVEKGYLARIRTSFEQVEALFPARMEEDERKNYEYGAWAILGIGIDVQKAADEENARRRERRQSTVALEDQIAPVNMANLKQTQWVLEQREQRRARGDLSDQTNEGDSELDGESVGAPSEGVDRDADMGDFDDQSDEEQPQMHSISPQQRARSITIEAEVEDDGEDGQADDENDLPLPPSAKRLKRNPSPIISPVLSPVVADDFAEAVDFAASFRAPAASQKARRPPQANPFTSPDKVVRSRRAIASSPPRPLPFESDPEDDAPLLSLRDEPDVRQSTPSSDTITPEDEEEELAPPQAQQVELDPMDLEDLEQLSASAFEYQPTPTQVDNSAPDDLPPHLRSHVDLSLDRPVFENWPGSYSSSASSDSRLMPPPSSSHSAAPSSALQELALPTTRKVTFANASSSEVSDTGSQGSSPPNPTERLPMAESQQSNDTSQPSASSSTPLVPAIAPPLRPTQYPLSRNHFVFALPPPTLAEIMDTLEINHQPMHQYQDPYFSKAADIPGRVSGDKRVHRWEHGGRRHELKDATVLNLLPFSHEGVQATRKEVLPPRRRRWKAWEYAARPPSLKQMKEWLATGERDASGRTLEERRLAALEVARHIEAPTQKHAYVPINGVPTQKEPQHMAVLAMELHTNTRGKLLPDPKEDAIVALFYCLKTESEDIDFNGRAEDTHVGVIAVGEHRTLKRLGGPFDYKLTAVETEHELMIVFLDLLKGWDPECVAGYEVHSASWGYLMERAHYGHDWSILADLGRVTRHDQSKHGDAKSDRWGFTQSSTLSFTGRHVLPIWRILKSDNKMQHNSFEHVVRHVLQITTPHFSWQTLTNWYESGDPRKVSRVFEYWRNRVELDIEMLDAAEIIEQNCEFARVFGVDFRSVRTRGSQFKVESVLFKLSKPESFMMLSPSRTDVGRQNAAECQPLIMEPQSAFYKGPLVVLDFTSLYPSCVIAHNYCWSTCLGRVDSFKGSAKLGTTNLEHPPGLLAVLKDHITVSPNGMMFVKPHIRKSLMAKMVSELLDTRVMVKASMKAVGDDKALTKLLNARQLALKFLANVTYGYIGATFSGRMPCVEVADAIVQTGRETLEKALETIHRKKEWGARVVYGDTDSLFIYLPGKTKDDAFRIGHEMADTVTSMNPRPIRLKFEKIYLPCVLVAKKRYVGFKFEKPSEIEPEFEVKGLEIIRRDGTPATQKMQENCIKILFRTSDISLVKEYCLRQWKRILDGDASPQDFIIAKAVKLGSYAEGRAPPPGAAVAARAMQQDPRGEPEYGERVPYILTQAEPGTKQVDRALSPQDFLADPRLRIDAEHYILRALIPPIARVFNLVGVDIKRWWQEMPKSKRLIRDRGGVGSAKVLLDEHFVSDRCRICRGPEGEGGICASCKTKPGEVAYAVNVRVRQAELKQRALHEICASCSSTRNEEGIECDSVDCPVMWERAAGVKELKEARSLLDLIPL